MQRVLPASEETSRPFAAVPSNREIPVDHAAQKTKQRDWWNR